MSIFRNISLKSKLVSVILAVTMFSLFIGFLVTGIQSYNQYKSELLNSTELTAKLTGDYSAATLMFGDAYNKDAETILQNLKNIPNLVSGRLYGQNGFLFAKYGEISEKEILIDKLQEGSSSTYTNKYLHVIKPIVYVDTEVGYIYMIVSTEQLNEKIKFHIITMIILFIFTSLIAYIFALQLQKTISSPILDLTKLTEKVSKEANYSVRTESFTNDEIGTLSKGFNEMLHQIQLRQDEIRNSNRALIESENKYRLLADNLQDVIWTCDTNFKITYISPSVFLTTGFTPEEILVFPGEKIFPKDSLTKFTETLTDLKSNKTNNHQRSVTIEAEVFKKDGLTRPIEMKISFLKDDKNNLIGFAGTNRDITERKEAEKILLESEQRYRTLSNSSFEA
ncbi:MAG: PAS domain S-box protein, partial [Melioribacteraceae bacterium]|nr:PAS domain S-box protein [Melioribacteraceae bacterium]